MVNKKKFKDPIVLLRGKIKAFKKERQALLHDNNIDTITNQLTTYQKNKNLNHKKGRNIYYKLSYLNRKIRNLNSELLLKYNIDGNLDSDSDSDSNDNLETLIILKCTNCH